MKINWKVRLKNKMFWVTAIPMLLLLAKQICELCGLHIEVEALSNNLVEIIGTLFGVLALVGVVTDPTTEGVNDSKRAMDYEAPAKDE